MATSGGAKWSRELRPQRLELPPGGALRSAGVASPSGSGAAAALPTLNAVVLARHLALIRAYRDALQEEGLLPAPAQERVDTGRSGRQQADTALLLSPERGAGGFEAWRGDMRGALALAQQRAAAERG
ncbi:hypothetical protein Rsub_10999 [Raphidocelis subcapitata]|uniref:Uncharacterized protein n=1 Tax=Raphidocelis subcapitata TaxID=307507 RepID=A0A2V0PEF4_9CHLO|nr:hypothetical protein Rsub_10999 [Raphidocelis subcapitata]|eukprot:GBF97352.1 hypothetical protein Rsub_10999 [Raphidocelis subcapitata]